MPRISEMMESKYLRKEDLDEDAAVTIVGVKKTNIAREDEEPQMKWLIKFEEFEKPMVLNSTNIQLTARACASDNTDDWKGKRVVIYVDDNVSFQGKLVGGLRIRALKKAGRVAQEEAGWGEAPPEAPPLNDMPLTEDDVPF